MATRVTVNLPDSAVEAIRQLAKERGITHTEAIRQAIESERFLREQQREGGKILLAKGDETQQIVFR